MTDNKATDKQWAHVTYWSDKDEGGCQCLLELRARVEALEAKYETMRLATLEWGKGVENLQRWNDQHLMRIERLEGTRRPASKVHEISEPLQLTPEQAQHVAALLAPNSKPTPNDRQIRSSLVERVERRIRYAHEVGGFQARAAIREVAAWLREQHDGDLVAVTVLEQEANR